LIERLLFSIEYIELKNEMKLRTKNGKKESIFIQDSWEKRAVPVPSWTLIG
jgi:hypothetical protein